MNIPIGSETLDALLAKAAERRVAQQELGALRHMAEEMELPGACEMGESATDFDHLVHILNECLTLIRDLESMYDAVCDADIAYLDDNATADLLEWFHDEDRPRAGLVRRLGGAIAHVFEEVVRGIKYTVGKL